MLQSLSVATLLLALLAASAVASEENHACGAILCLAGEMQGSSGGGECSQYITQYFSITVKHHGDFNPARTARQRLEFLNQCPSGESNTKEQVNDRYGTRRGL